MSETRGAPGRHGLLLLGLAGAIAVAGFAAAALLVALPIFHEVLDKSFETIQVTTLAGWALAVTALLAAPLVTLHEMGARVRLSSLVELDGDPVLRTLGRAIAAHLIAFMTWPASFLLGPFYSFAIFRGHMMLTAAVVVTATILALMRIYAWRSEHVAARPSRVSHGLPAGF